MKHAQTAIVALMVEDLSALADDAKIMVSMRALRQAALACELAEQVAMLNPEADTIGCGMLKSLVELARKVSPLIDPQ